MPAPTTTAELLNLVYQSGLADEVQLRAQVANLPALPPDPRDFAAALVRDGILTYFQAEQLVQGKWKSFNIGMYALLEKIGSGKSCMFFLCEHTKLHRVVAVKMMAPVLADQPGNLDRLYREARVLAACSHPNIVRAFDIDRDNNLHFLVTEYIDGTNLLDIVRRGPLDPVRVAHYIAQAADALEHIHELHLVHRNVKPGKLLLDRAGCVKLRGLNLALFRDAPHVEEDIRGTPNYIAPEQALDSSPVDGRADVYSLGCSAYHLLTGRPPFTGASAAQKMVWHQIREPEPIRALRPEVPEELARVVEKMMGKAPGSRYQSAAEVAAALAPWRATPIPPPPAEELPNYCPRVREAIERSSRTQPGTS